MGAKAMKIYLQDEYNVTIGYDTMWMGRERALHELYGGWNESFSLLLIGRLRLKRDHQKVLLRLTLKLWMKRYNFIGFLCIDRFLAGCRPCISIGVKVA
jgi:hypothetical protein